MAAARRTVPRELVISRAVPSELATGSHDHSSGRGTERDKAEDRSRVKDKRNKRRE